VTWLRKETERQPVRVEVEDLHWADPSTVEFLTLLVEQIPTMRALLVLTFRPEFTPPWPLRAHMLPLHLDRLSRPQMAEMAQRVAGKALPSEVVQQVMTKADGVPLFVEELTKTVIESGHLQETAGGYEVVSRCLGSRSPPPYTTP
jgi:predicted ATPase